MNTAEDRMCVVLVQIEPHMNILDIKMRHPINSELFAYWQRLRGSNPAPLRNAIEPSDIRKILPDIFILEKTAEGTAGFRLAGTRICTLFGREFRGHRFSTMWDSASSARIEHVALDVMDHSAPMIFSAQANIDPSRLIDIEIMMLPVSSTDGQTDRLIGSLALLNPTQLWAGEIVQSLHFDNVRVLNSDNVKAGMPGAPIAVEGEDKTAHNPSAFGPSAFEPSAFEPSAFVPSAFVPSTLGLFFHRVMHLRVFDGGRQD